MKINCVIITRTVNVSQLLRKELIVKLFSRFLMFLVKWKFTGELHLVILDAES